MLRKLVAFGSLVAILLASFQVLDVLLARPDVSWQSFAIFILPAVMLAILTIANLWASAFLLRIASVAAVLGLLILSVIQPIALLPSGLALLGLVALNLSRRAGAVANNH